MSDLDEISSLVAAGKRLEYTSGSPWEPVYGYTRAVRIGSIITVSGTTSLSSGSSASAQTRGIFDIITTALKKLGGSLRDVTRVRAFLRDEADFDAVMRVHGEIFGRIGVRPAATALAGVKMIELGILVEIEVDAIVGAGEVVRIS